MVKVLQFCVKNVTNGQVLSEFSETPEFDENDGMWVKQVYAFGDVIEGVKFTCQVLPEKGYAIFIHSDFSTVKKTHYVSDTPLELQYDYRDGNSFVFSARSKPQEKMSLFKRLLSSILN